MKGHNWGLCKKCGKTHVHVGTLGKRGLSGGFPKGHKPWNKGLTKESDERLKRKSESMISYNPMKRLEIATKASQTRKGKPFSKEHKEKISIAMTGINNHQWRGGVASEPYDIAFNRRFRRLIRERDNYNCQKCGDGGRCVHHIDYNKINTIKENCITLCVSCNSVVNADRNYWQDYFENIMKRRIISLCP